MSLLLTGSFFLPFPVSITNKSSFLTSVRSPPWSLSSDRALSKAASISFWSNCISKKMLVYALIKLSLSPFPNFSFCSLRSVFSLLLALYRHPFLPILSRKIIIETHCFIFRSISCILWISH